jgi:hypothetical protein
MKTNPNVVTGSTNLHYMGNRNSHNSTLDTGNLHSNHDDDKDNGERKEYSNRNRQSRFKSNTIAVLNNK